MNNRNSSPDNLRRRHEKYKNAVETLMDLEKMSSVEDIRSAVLLLEDAVMNGSGKACFALASLYSADTIDIPKELRASFPVSQKNDEELFIHAYGLLKQEAEDGDGEAMHIIAVYYQAGIPPVFTDLYKCLEWNENAYNAGYIFAGNDLYSMYSDPSSEFFNMDRAQGIMKVLQEKNMCVVR